MHLAIEIQKNPKIRETFHNLNPKTPYFSAHPTKEPSRYSFFRRIKAKTNVHPTPRAPRRHRFPFCGEINRRNRLSRSPRFLASIQGRRKARIATLSGKRIATESHWQVASGKWLLRRPRKRRGRTLPFVWVEARTRKIVAIGFPGRVRGLANLAGRLRSLAGEVGVRVHGRNVCSWIGLRHKGAWGTRGVRIWILGRAGEWWW